MRLLSTLILSMFLAGNIYAIDGEYDGFDSDIWPSETSLFRKEYTDDLWVNSNEVSGRTVYSDFSTVSNALHDHLLEDVKYGVKGQRIIDAVQLDAERRPLPNVIQPVSGDQIFRKSGDNLYRTALLEIKDFVADNLGGVSGSEPFCDDVHLTGGNLPAGKYYTVDMQTNLPFLTITGLLTRVGMPTNWCQKISGGPNGDLTPHRALEGRGFANDNDYEYGSFDMTDYGWKGTTSVVGKLYISRDDPQAGYLGDIVRLDGTGTSYVSWSDAKDKAEGDLDTQSGVSFGGLQKWTKGLHGFNSEDGVGSNYWTAQMRIVGAAWEESEASGTNSHTLYTYSSFTTPSSFAHDDVVFLANGEGTASGAESFSTTDMWIRVSAAVNLFYTNDAGEIFHTSGPLIATNSNPTWCADPTQVGLGEGDDSYITWKGFQGRNDPFAYTIYDFDYNY